jgi:hypothetical protein
MIALLARIAGLWLVAGAMVALVVDATRIIASSSFTLTPMGATWLALGPRSLESVQKFVEENIGAYIGQWLWDPVIQWVLMVPTWAALGALGFALTYLGGRRRSRAHYI